MLETLNSFQLPAKPFGHGMHMILTADHPGEDAVHVRY